jgi:hypothetical protein
MVETTAYTATENLTSVKLREGLSGATARTLVHILFSRYMQVMPSPPGSISTLADLHRHARWLWLDCTRCNHRRPQHRDAMIAAPFLGMV